MGQRLTQAPTPEVSKVPRHRRGTLRSLVVGLPAVVLLAAGVARLRTDTQDDKGSRPSMTQATTSGERPLGQREGLSDKPQGQGGGGSGEQTVHAPMPVSPDEQFIAIGALHERRLYAIGLNELVAAARRRETKELSIAGVSPVVGSPIAAAYAGTDVVLASTNVRTLVKLGRDWKEPVELAITEPLGSGDADLRYGAVVPVDATHVAVSVAFRNKVGVVVVDVPTFKVTQTKVFTDRFAGYPSLCRSDSGRLFLMSTGVVDVLDGPTLKRIASLEAQWAPTAAACVGRQAWITDNSTPTGRIVDEAGKQVGSFEWTGNSSGYLRYSKEHGRVFGTDSVAGVVFSCALTGGRCTASASVGIKPTDVLVTGQYVIVTVENDNAVAVLRAGDLGLEGRTSFPGPPRTVTLMQH